MKTDENYVQKNTGITVQEQGTGGGKGGRGRAQNGSPEHLELHVKLAKTNPHRISCFQF